MALEIFFFNSINRFQFIWIAPKKATKYTIFLFFIFIFCFVCFFSYSVVIVVVVLWVLSSVSVIGAWLNDQCTKYMHSFASFRFSGFIDLFVVILLGFFLIFFCFCFAMLLEWIKPLASRRNQLARTHHWPNNWKKNNTHFRNMYGRVWLLPF